MNVVVTHRADGMVARLRGPLRNQANGAYHWVLKDGVPTDSKIYTYALAMVLLGYSKAAEVDWCGVERRVGQRGAHTGHCGMRADRARGVRALNKSLCRLSSDAGR